MKKLTRFTLFLKYFGWFKVAMIGYLRPKIITLTSQTIIVKIPLNRRSKNHLNSMYFGALAVGADIAGGLHGFYHADKMNRNISLAFKTFQAHFLSRPESDVYFVSEMGNTVHKMLITSQQQQKRINQAITVTAYTDYQNEKKKVATFTLELSIKVLTDNRNTHHK